LVTAVNEFRFKFNVIDLGALANDDILVLTPSTLTTYELTGAVAVAMSSSNVIMIERPLLATTGGVEILTTGAAAFAGAGLMLWSTAVNVPARSAVATTVCKILRRSLRWHPRADVVMRSPGFWSKWAQQNMAQQFVHMYM
jgi:hypothetical protein